MPSICGCGWWVTGGSRSSAAAQANLTRTTSPKKWRPREPFSIRHRPRRPLVAPARTKARGGEDERPHLIPLTDMGRRLVEIDSTGFMGRTGLCPGDVTLEDGQTTMAYRFVSLSAAAAVQLIEQLDEIVTDLERGCAL